MGSTRSFRASRIALAAFVAAGLGLGTDARLSGGAFGLSQAQARSAPESFADLAAEVVDAVVNISASQTVEEKRGGMPNLPQGTPFDDLFEEFFKRRQGQGGPNSETPRQRRSNSLGSGFVVDPSGIVITNNHVIADASEITVIFTDGRKLKAELLGRDPKIDVAVLKVKSDKPLKAVKFGDSEKLRVGDWVLAVGNPFGLGGTVTAGIVSARNRNIDSGPYDNYIQTDASINKGNSGGPLFNMQGEVIGVNTAILSPTGGSVGIGFASPSSSVVPVVEQLKQYGETRRGWLGVRIQNVDDDIAASLGLDRARGALVAGVDDRGPAKPAGIEPGDVILKFDGKDIKVSRDLPALVAGMPVGKEVEVTILRKGKEATRTVKLGRLEDTEKASLTAKNGDQGKIETPVKKALGLELQSLSDEARKRFSIKESVKGGVVVTQVEPRSNAAEKRIQAGDVIAEVNQEPVTSPTDLTKKIEAAKSAGRKNVLLLVMNAQGDSRFVAIAVE